MRLFISMIILQLLIPILGVGQVDKCGFDKVTNKQSLVETNEEILQAVNKMDPWTKNEDTIKVIPVVVHVIHDGGGENISDGQIESQIRVLNEDYGKLPGTNGDGNGVDTEVRFFLANLDPNGNCTNGIVRINSPLANHQSYQRAFLKDLSFWDNTRYLNIYVVKTINGGVGGYSSFPDGPDEEDGIVIRHNLFGDMGTAGSGLGRTGSHELGHWLGLFHTFNNSCGSDVCNDGDYVCDTPPAFEPNYTCNTLNTCSNDNPDLNDQKENYMDYTPDACQNMLTAGQKMRIHASLNNFRTLIWSDANLLSTGYDSVYTPPPTCPLVADFVTLTTEVCFGNSVYFSDKSLNGGTSWQWDFPGGNPASSTDQNPTIEYPSIGIYPVTLIVSDGSTNDTLTIQDYITVTEPGTGDPISFSEDFESGIFPPAGIDINNPDGEITWELDSAASTSGMYSIRINNLINTNYGSSDEIILPYLDFTSIPLDPPAYMSFNWAYARSDPSFSDEMIVLISTDCGVNFNPIYYRTGNTFVTGPTQTTPFIPTQNQWKTADIDLEDYQGESYVRLKIVNVTDGGNNLYIDDIYIGNGEDIMTSVDHLLQEDAFSVYPNPVSDGVIVDFRLEGPDEIAFKIFNPQGMLVKEIPAQTFLSGDHHLTINVSELPDGLYLITSDTGESIFTKKILIQSGH